MNFWIAATISGAFVGRVEIRHRLVSVENGIIESVRNSLQRPKVSSASSSIGLAVNLERGPLELLPALVDRRRKRLERRSVSDCPTPLSFGSSSRRHNSSGDGPRPKLRAASPSRCLSASIAKSSGRPTKASVCMVCGKRRDLERHFGHHGKRPQLPVNPRATSRPARFFITRPPDLKSSPRPLTARTPSRLSRALPAEMRRSPKNSSRRRRRWRALRPARRSRARDRRFEAEHLTARREDRLDLEPAYRTCRHDEFGRLIERHALEAGRSSARRPQSRRGRCCEGRHAPRPRCHASRARASQSSDCNSHSAAGRKSSAHDRTIC